MRSAFKGDEDHDFFDSTYALHRSLSYSTVVPFANVGWEILLRSIFE